MGELTKAVRVGGLTIGGGSPVTIQSMLSIPWQDTQGNVDQAKRLEVAGCQIIRVAIPCLEAVGLLPKLKEAVTAPIVADIHFDARIAVEATHAGADKIRINPGNIGGEDRVAQVARACRQRGIPIRVGANSGSISKEMLARFGGPTAQALAESALGQVRLLEKCDFDDIVISVKASDVPAMVAACRLIDGCCRYPQHLGVTEAGTPRMGLVKSAAGLGALLLDGIGDTIRVSLTADPAEEVAAALDILSACGIRRDRPELISCPTCGRCQVDLLRLAAQVERLLDAYHMPVKVAVMGCAVNGPGEAREADVGIAGGDGDFLLFKKGVPVRKLQQDQVLPALREELDKLCAQRKG